MTEKEETTILPVLRLLSETELQVINLGLARFAETFEQQGLTYIQVDWRPPAGGDHSLAEMLAALDR
jgi:hypothetical protein